MKGQYNFGLVISATILLFIVVFAVSVLVDIMSPHFLKGTESERRAIAYSTVRLLLADEGAWSGGTDWESHPEQISRLGLSATYGTLSPSKVSALSKVSRKKLSATLPPGYDYRICITETENCDLADARTSDVLSQTGEKQAVVPAALNGRPVQLKVIVW